TQKGNGTTTVSGNATIGDGTNYSYHLLGDGDGTNRTLNLNGNTTHQSALLYLSHGSVINNNGTFTSKGDVRNGEVYDNGMYHNYQSDLNAFNNAGTFVQDASGKQTSINTAFNNSGTVNVKSGTLSLSGGGTSTGSFNTQTGQTLEFAGGTHNLNGSTHTNDGTFKVSGGEINFNSHSTTLTGNGDLNVTGGTVNINGTGSLSTSSLNHNGGTIGGSGSLVTTVLNWFGYGSTQKGNGTTTVSGNATIGDGTNYSSYHLGDGDGTNRTLNLNGNTTHQSALLYLSHGSVINNNGTFTSKGDVRNGEVYDNGMYHNYQSDLNAFNNAGTFVQDASGKQTSIGVAFNNTGTVNVKSGSLYIQNLTNYDQPTQALTGGRYEVQNNGTLAVNLINNLQINNAEITLRGANAKLLNSTNNTNALSTLAKNNGSIALMQGAALSTGAFTNTGAVLIGNGSNFASTGDYTQTSGRTVVNGSLSANEVNVAGGSLSGTGWVIGNVSNSGLIGPGASPGTLNIDGDYTQLSNGSLLMEIGGNLQGSSFDWLNITGNATLGGTLNLVFAANYLPVSNSIYNILTYGSWSQTTFNLVTVSGLNLNQFSYNTIYSDKGVSISVSVIPVPEPDNIALIFAGLGLISFMARRKNS
ncbi:beta strand repeat-containing protein, partial [Methylophilus glucosoxydans]